jgi:hypothetical protein
MKICEINQWFLLELILYQIHKLEVKHMVRVVLVKLVGYVLFSSMIKYTKYDILFVGARIILFIAFLLAFGSLIGGAWVLFGYYIPYKKETIYPGIAIFLHNLAIFIRFVPIFSHFLLISCRYSAHWFWNLVAKKILVINSMSTTNKWKHDDCLL